MSAYSRMKQLAAEKPSSDHFVGALLAGGYLLFHFDNIGRPHLSQATTLIVYQTLVGIGAALLGLVFAAIAIIRALDPGRRLAVLQAQHGRRITEAMKAVIRGLGLATLATLLAMLLDQPNGAPIAARALALFAVGLGAARMTRLAWIFSLMLDVNDSDARLEAHDKAEPLPINRKSALG